MGLNWLAVRRIEVDQNKPGTKSKEICLLSISFCCNKKPLGNKYYTVGNLVYFSLNGTTCKESAFVAPMKNLPTWQANGPCCSGQLVSNPNMPRLTDLVLAL